MGSMKDLLGDEPFTFPVRPAPVLLDGIPGDVARLFEKLAFDIIEKGFDHYSSDAILHRIRWHYAIERGIRDFKCNNNWTSKLARWFVNKHPQHAKFFELRTSPGQMPS